MKKISKMKIFRTNLFTIPTFKNKFKGNKFISKRNLYEIFQEKN